MSEPVQEAMEARHAKNKWRTRAWIFGIIAMVAILAAGLLTILYLNDSRNQVAATSDAQRQQFITCQDLPKTDPRCQQPVAPPAQEVIKGAQGIPGVQGIQGPPGPQGVQGPQGPPGSPGKNGITPPCVLMLGGCKGTKGDKGDSVKGDKGDKGDSVKGDKGDPGTDGKDGEPCLPTNPECRGPQGPQGTQGADGVGLSSMTCPDDNDPLTADPFHAIYTDGKDQVIVDSVCRPATPK
jgi:hypothetical protein